MTGDPHGDHIPTEHEPTGFLTPEQVDEKFDAWIALHEAERDDSPDPFDW